MFALAFLRSFPGFFPFYGPLRLYTLHPQEPITMKYFLYYFISSIIVTVTGAVLIVAAQQIALFVLLVGFFGFIMSAVVLVQWLLQSEELLKNEFYSEPSKLVKTH